MSTLAGAIDPHRRSCPVGTACGSLAGYHTHRLFDCAIIQGHGRADVATAKGPERNTRYVNEAEDDATQRLHCGQRPGVFPSRAAPYFKTLGGLAGSDRAHEHTSLDIVARPRYQRLLCFLGFYRSSSMRSLARVSS